MFGGGLSSHWHSDCRLPSESSQGCHEPRVGGGARRASLTTTLARATQQAAVGSILPA